ncbi:hypothetical protein HGRIS_005695 [Hohenbuehelia grisea]|uniref:Heterokaryon incompatibility domain-containing protein n=1 Tax=Hohenbuehelia grisea TaxID=104357 RepID=A0ABR3JYP7_9AGAR
MVQYAEKLPIEKDPVHISSQVEVPPNVSGLLGGNSFVKSDLQGILNGRITDFLRKVNILRPALEERLHQGPIRLLRLSASEDGIDVQLQSRTEIMEEVVAELRSMPIIEDPAVLKSTLTALTRYAVLSHRWSSRIPELSFDDTKELCDKASKKGFYAEDIMKEVRYRKVLQYCGKAIEYGCRYAWFDSGCINQRSSAELNESIEAMFQWYRNAEVCIVHLGSTNDPSTMEDDKWFRRGWTLQELLASQKMKFFNAQWHDITPERYDIVRLRSAQDTVNGTAQPRERLFGQLMPTISKAELYKKVVCTTQIDSKSLDDFEPGLAQARSIISWMVNRRTRRPEDRAYCLLGLLDLHLPIAYGEGFDRAFFRLQVEIMSKTDDRGFFLWAGQPSTRNSMFARDPTSLAASPVKPSDRLVADILYRSMTKDTDYIDQSLPLSNIGLRMQVTLCDIRCIDLRHAPDGLLMMEPVLPIGKVAARASWNIWDARSQLDFEHFRVNALDMKWDQDWRGEIETPHLKLGLLGSRRLSTGPRDSLWAVVLREDNSRIPRRYSRVAAINPFPVHWPEEGSPLALPERIYVV